MADLPSKPLSATRAAPLRVGFLALTDAAPFAVAQERGYFSKHGITVQLSREVGWATIREKIIYGELDAAHAPAPMLWATRLGIDSAPCPVLTAFVLNLHGNALTLSNRLWSSGVRDPQSLRDEARRRSGERKLTFGVVFAFSSHHIHLLRWLRAAGIDPQKDVRIVVVPPAQMFRNLAAGTIDGYFAGEPWGSLAVRENAGWCATWSAALHPGHVEKVLMVTERFAERCPTEHAALIQALHDACTWCDDPSNREALVSLLAGSAYINQSTRILSPALLGHFDAGQGRLVSVQDFHVFHGRGANVPTLEKAAGLQRDLIDSGLLKPDMVEARLPALLFREDLYRQALSTQPTHELVS